jgi:hypothetical protein
MNIESATCTLAPIPGMVHATINVLEAAPVGWHGLDTT